MPCIRSQERRESQLVPQKKKGAVRVVGLKNKGINNMECVSRAKMDEFTCVRTLGSGFHAKVKLAEDSEGRLYAIKKFKSNSSLEVLKTELAMMSRLSHPNIVNLVGIRDHCLYTKKNGSTYECLAIVLQFAEGGELFEFLLRTGRFGPEISRTFFLQLLDGLQHIHQAGVAHRDLKPENVLLDESFRPKIADFGFSCLKQGKDKSGVLHTSLGTEGYKAPQVSTRSYSGEKADIFSLGVILFIMYTGTPPFEKADPRDYYYKMHVNGRQEAFWASHSKKKPVGFFSQPFIHLVNRMLAYKPEDRPSIAQIREMEWARGDIVMQPELKSEFARRKQKVDEEVMAERKQKEQKKAKGVMFEGAKFRGEELVDDFEPGLTALDLASKPRLIRKLGKHDSPKFQIASSAEEFMTFLADFARRSQKSCIELGDLNFSLKGSFELSESEMAMGLGFVLTDSEDEQNTSESKLKVRVLEGEGRLFCDVVRQAGSSWHFNSILGLLRDSYFRS